MVIFISFASQNILSKASSPVICLGTDYVKHVNLLSFFFFRFFACGRLLAICRDQKKNCSCPTVLQLKKKKRERELT